MQFTLLSKKNLCSLLVNATTQLNLLAEVNLQPCETLKLDLANGSGQSGSGLTHAGSGQMGSGQKTGHPKWVA